MNKKEIELIEKEIEDNLKAGECGLASNNEKFQWTNTANAMKKMLEENKKLKDNWNKLKEWVNKHYDYYMNNEDYIGGRLCFTDMKSKMQELEQGSDSNEEISKNI